jgi:hypothetical protein
MASGAKSLPKCIQVFWIIAWLACGPVDLEHLKSSVPVNGSPLSSQHLVRQPLKTLMTMFRRQRHTVDAVTSSNRSSQRPATSAF